MKYILQLRLYLNQLKNQPNCIILNLKINATLFAVVYTHSSSFNSFAKQTYYQPIAEYTHTACRESSSLTDWAKQANPNNKNLKTIVMYVILLTCES